MSMSMSYVYYNLFHRPRRKDRERHLRLFKVEKRQHTSYTVFMYQYSWTRVTRTGTQRGYHHVWKRNRIQAGNTPVIQDLHCSWDILIYRYDSNAFTRFACPETVSKDAGFDEMAVDQLCNL